ncbi:MAG: hypothetical protein K2X48_15315 [Chitinophagaceae bacterium]|nr:hypothetical protein [Chitinophagaceae bacterium]
MIHAKQTTLFLLAFHLCFSIYCKAQVFFELQPIGKGNTHMGTFYGTEGLYKDVPYARIKGSPFWDDDWRPATLYDNNYDIIGRMPVKLNLATGELYYLKNNEPLVVADDLVRKVVIHTDTVSFNVRAVFVSFMPFIYAYDKKVNDYVRVFHAGKAILIKYTKREMKVADSLFGTQKRYYFADDDFYFLQFNNKVERVKKLNKELLFSLLPGAYSLKAWINQNKLDLRKEEDVVKFIEYYNSVKEQGGT